MGAGNVSIVNVGNVQVGVTRDQQKKLLEAAGFTMTQTDAILEPRKMLSENLAQAKYPEHLYFKNVALKK